MSRYIFRRLIQSVPIFFGITLLSYLLMAASGNPVKVLAFGPNVTPREVERLSAQLGVNDPVLVQYLRWLIGDDWMRWDSDGDEVADGSFLIPLDANGDGEPEPPGTRYGVLRGDFGRSFFFRRSVLDVLGERLPATIELNITSLIVGMIVGLGVGIGAAVRRGGWFDNVSRVGSVIFSSLPSFWIGLIVLLFFGSVLPQWLFNAGLVAEAKPLFPLGGRCPLRLDNTCPPLYERLEYLILPTFILATGTIAGLSRFMRASMLDVIGQDYIRTAKAKGLAPRTVWLRHGMRNALIPIATFLGPTITGILGGAVITETVFSWPGIGQTAVAAVLQRDYPVVMAVTLYSAAAAILGYMLSDILYALIDPRIKLS